MRCFRPELVLIFAVSAACAPPEFGGDHSVEQVTAAVWSDDGAEMAFVREHRTERCEPYGGGCHLEDYDVGIWTADPAGMSPRLLLAWGAETLYDMRARGYLFLNTQTRDRNLHCLLRAGASSVVCLEPAGPTLSDALPSPSGALVAVVEGLEDVATCGDEGPADSRSYCERVVFFDPATTATVAASAPFLLSTPASFSWIELSWRDDEHLDVVTWVDAAGTGHEIDVGGGVRRLAADELPGCVERAHRTSSGPVSAAGRQLLPALGAMPGIGGPPKCE